MFGTRNRNARRIRGVWTLLTATQQSTCMFIWMELTVGNPWYWTAVLVYFWTSVTVECASGAILSLWNEGYQQLVIPVKDKCFWVMFAWAHTYYLWISCITIHAQGAHQWIRTCSLPVVAVIPTRLQHFNDMLSAFHWKIPSESWKQTSRGSLPCSWQLKSWEQEQVVALFPCTSGDVPKLSSKDFMYQYICA